MQKQKVINFLQKKFDAEISDISHVDKGEWSDTHFFKAGNQDLVIRISDLQENFMMDKFAYEKYSSSVPIPRILEVGEFEGKYFAISERAFGKFIDNLNKKEMRLILPGLFELFHKMRQLDTSNSSGYGSWDSQGNGKFKSWKDFLLDVIEDTPNKPTSGWKQNLSESKFKLFDLMKIYNKLKKYINYCPETRYVIHSDLIHYNLLVSNSADEITSVLDWGCAKYGDFLYDVAWFDFWKFWYKSMRNIDYSKITRTHLEQQGLPTTNIDKRILCYKIHIALDSFVYASFKKRWDFYAKVRAEILLSLT